MTKKDYSSSVNFVITGKNLDPDVVTENLSLVASQSWRRGEKRIFRSGREHVYPHGGWKLFAQEQEIPLSLELQLHAWAIRLSPKAEEIRALAASGLSVALDCYLSTANAATIQLDAKLLTTLGNLGVNVVFNVFKEEDD